MNCNFAKTIHAVFFFILIVMAINLEGQRLLQLEIFREVQAIKFGEGDVITFKSKEFPKDWQTKKIERIIVEDSIIVFEEGMIPVREITHFRLTNNTAKAIGNIFTTFSAGWFFFGAIAHFTSSMNKFTWSSFAIGATGFAVGMLLKKIVSKRTLRMGKTANLRLIDISFPTPAEIMNTGKKP